MVLDDRVTFATTQSQARRDLPNRTRSCHMGIVRQAIRSSEDPVEPSGAQPAPRPAAFSAEGPTGISRREPLA